MDVSKVFEFPVQEFWRQPRALIGPGAWEMSGPEAAAMGLKHVLIVTSGLSGTGIVDEVKRNFEDAGVAVSVYGKVESNPKDYNVMDSYKAFVDGKCDGFVSLGGGSSHDTAKGARIVAAHDGRNTNEFEGLNKSEKLENPPQIAINTTNGTGSETTPFYVITDLSSPKAPHKWVGADRAATTTLAINDPLLMMTQPPEYIAYTGFDTLAHASECYAGRVQHPSTTPIALKAIQLTAENLREAAYNPRNYNAMANMCWAQYTAAQAFSSGFLGILHSLSHAVCAYYDIHHGLNNGVGIPRVWTYNQPAAAERYAEIAGAMGEDTKGMSATQAGDRAIEAVIRLARDCGIPDNFESAKPYAKSRIGVGWYKKRPTDIKSDDKELKAMAQHMMDDLCTPGNPRDLTLEGAYEVLRDCVYDPMEVKGGRATNGNGAVPRPTAKGRARQPARGARKSSAVAGGG